MSAAACKRISEALRQRLREEGRAIKADKAASKTAQADEERSREEIGGLDKVTLGCREEGKDIVVIFETTARSVFRIRLLFSAGHIVT
jgi:hypothetical protein